MCRKINPPIVGVLCSCNAAVMTDRCCVRRLCSVRVDGARSTAGSALSGRFATSVSANHAIAGSNESSAEALATLRRCRELDGKWAAGWRVHGPACQVSTTSSVRQTLFGATNGRLDSHISSSYRNRALKQSTSCTRQRPAQGRADRFRTRSTAPTIRRSSMPWRRSTRRRPTGRALSWR